MNLYYLDVSPPCRSVLILGRILGLDFNLKAVNLQNHDQLKRDFLSLNPCHTVPTLEITENGSKLVLWESRVILTYLVNVYGEGDAKKLYPKDVEKRALVDLYLQFDLSTLYQRTQEYYFPTILLGAHLDESKKARLAEALQFFEAMLNKERKFATSDDFTVADLTLSVTVSQIDAFKFDMLPYPKIKKWLKECKVELESFGYEELNESKAEALATLFRSRLKI